jgi:hypothetical protein
MPEHDTSPDTVTGRFGSPESARAAMVRLEAAGFDADAVNLEQEAAAVSRTDAATKTDLDATGDVGKSAGLGAALGGAAGVAAGIVTTVVTGDAGAGAMVGTAGTVGGTVVGGLAGTYAGLPVNNDAWTTYELDPSDPHPVMVRVRVASPEEADAARTALRGS